MQTVKFSCAQCGKPMAVGSDLLGKQVRCPHCKQVIVAPATAAAPPVPAPVPDPPPVPVPSPAGQVEPVFRVPPPRNNDEEGSIFGAEEEGDDLFNAPPGATLEVPPAPPPAPVPAGGWPNLQLGAAARPGAPAGQIAASDVSAPTMALTGAGGVNGPPDGTATLPLSQQWAAPSSAEDASAPSGEQAPPSAAFQLAEQRTRQDSILTAYLLIFLVPYAILMTGAAIWFYYQSQRIHPLYELNDWPRDTRDPSKLGPTQRMDDTRPLPPELRISLGQVLTVGDLQVTPQKVEQRKIFYRPGTPAPSQDDALVLTLLVKNVATDYQFAPNDLAYNRYSDDKTPHANRPYTCVDLGSGTRFYGGPCKWPRAKFKRGFRESDLLEYIDGTQHNTFLKPGEEIPLIVCTNPENPEILNAIGTHPGTITWRIQLRRGLMRIRDKEGTATFVFGVDFKKDDIQPK